MRLGFLLVMMMSCLTLFSQDVMQQFYYAGGGEYINPLLAPDGVTPCPDGWLVVAYLAADPGNPQVDLLNDPHGAQLVDNYWAESHFNSFEYDGIPGFFFTNYFMWRDPYGQWPEPVAHCGDAIYWVIFNADNWEDITEYRVSSQFFIGPEPGAETRETEIMEWSQGPHNGWTPIDLSVDPPVLIYPANGTLDVLYPLTLEWQIDGTVCDGYLVFLDGELLAEVSSDESATYTLAEGLPDGSAHQWSVAAMYGETQAMSPVWTFTTANFMSGFPYGSGWDAGSIDGSPAHPNAVTTVSVDTTDQFLVAMGETPVSVGMSGQGQVDGALYIRARASVGSVTVDISQWGHEPGQWAVFNGLGWTRSPHPSIEMQEGSATFWPGGSGNDVEICWAPSGSNLPFFLESFSATGGEDGNVSLDWVTVDTANLACFDIRRASSTDLALSQLITPEPIPADNGSGPFVYRFVDTNPLTDGPAYYWLEYRFGNNFATTAGPLLYLPGSVPGENQIPADVGHAAINSVYPNPFNPVTTISYHVPTDEMVSVDVFNIRGQKIASLVKGHIVAGCHQVVWDGTDTSGNEVAGGLYLCRLVVGPRMVVEKMTLLK